MRNKLPKINNVIVCITKACESSGNMQFFLRARRVDDQSFFGSGVLEYQCFQTKYNGHENTVEKCIDNAVFGADYLLRFFGLEPSDLQFNGFTEDELEIAKQSTDKWLR